MTASATALDAIIYGKAVFSLKNEAVSSLLQGYELFFEFDTIEKMSNAINDFDTDTISKVDFNKQREKFLITEFKTDIEKWLC
ncbi:hypothetical protein [Shewanella sp. ENK2]|uniref:hypothetical protein n=1 Tax=Shewanella sp. ENK2 TaxID=2775245 RepID=UPI00374785C9